MGQCLFIVFRRNWVSIFWQFVSAIHEKEEVGEFPRSMAETLLCRNDSHASVEAVNSQGFNYSQVDWYTSDVHASSPKFIVLLYLVAIATSYFFLMERCLTDLYCIVLLHRNFGCEKNHLQILVRTMRTCVRVSFFYTCEIRKARVHNKWLASAEIVYLRSTSLTSEKPTYSQEKIIFRFYAGGGRLRPLPPLLTTMSPHAGPPMVVLFMGAHRNFFRGVGAKAESTKRVGRFSAHRRR